MDMGTMIAGINAMSNRAPQQLSTQQANEASKNSTRTSQDRGRAQSEYERNARFNDMQRDGAYNLQYGADYARQVANPISNANAAREMALNTANTLNQMYAGSADRLLRSAADTQMALNNAGSTVASMFR